MQNRTKYDKILDALQELLGQKDIQNISVSEIARTAGIGKGSIYYYFSSKEALVDALVERSYKKPLETARHLAEQENVSPFTRMAMIFQACVNSSRDFRLQDRQTQSADDRAQALLHQKYIRHLVTEMKPELAEIIRQGIANGDVHFDYPEALAEVALIVLTVKLDNTIVPSSPEEIENTIDGLISLLENGTGNPKGSLNFLKV
ncbi:MAG: TetR/AcrR family transcriptional regulator [Lachnospiraceae bacterium]|nr:TetR/AcrR family transcriptional regulator [Lachnospiraceae bacterium]